MNEHNYTQRYLEFSSQILSSANKGVPRIVYLQKISKILLSISRCDALDLRVKDGELAYRWQAWSNTEKKNDFRILSSSESSKANLYLSDRTLIEHLIKLICTNDIKTESLTLKQSDGFWINDKEEALNQYSNHEEQVTYTSFDIDDCYRSYAFLPLRIDQADHGVLVLKNKGPEFFNSENVHRLEEITQTIGLGISDRRAQSALRERVKELTCLYGMAQIAENPGYLDEKLQKIVNILPKSWQFPEIAVSRIDLDDKTYLVSDYRKGKFQQCADITVKGKRRGQVEVSYTASKPEFTEGPFLSEETTLITEVARQLAFMVMKEETEKEKKLLQDQLHHADRLATIGNLAAGIAHEINEPLGSILGFAELVIKNPEITDSVKKDLEKIVNSSLHARTIVQKLLIFARQIPVEMTLININDIIKDVAYFLGSRCKEGNIDLELKLNDDLPSINANSVQLKQLLMNIMVNGIQAMPDGGILSLSTDSDEQQLVLVVKDTGIGMSTELKEKIFDPFYTTKDVGQGTGLGLSVVHGIVSSHDGSIEVKSSIGKGTSFEIIFPLYLSGKYKEG